MILSVKERLILLPLMPKNGNRLEMIIVNELFSKIDFSVEEIESFELKELPNGMVKGNSKNFADKNIDISSSQVKILKDVVKMVDERKQVTREMLPLLDKIDQL